MQAFGEFVKNLRIKKRITLREFCREVNLDASNWSKVERGILPPTKSKNVLHEICKALGLKEKSEEWLTIMDLAMIAHIPTELLDEKLMVENLPIFFRTNRGQKPTRQELDELIKMIENDSQE